MLKLTDLLEIENDPAFLTFRCSSSGLLLWPLVRNQFLRQLISDLYYRQSPMLAGVPVVRRRQAALGCASALKHNLNQRHLQGDVLIMATGAGHFQRDGRWFNRITDYLAQESPVDTVTVEGVVDWHVPYPRWNQQVIYWLPWQGAITVAGRLLVRGLHVATARELLEYARRRATELLGLSIADSNMDMLVGMLARKLARLQLLQHAYRRLLERVQPRLVLLEQACYGDFAPFNQIAREMGIRVAEPQHGMVSGGHDAYCYAPLLRESEAYRSCLPHDFLGYGSWWNSQIDVPVQKWVIGSPHYSEQRRSISLARSEQTDVLLLSDGIEFSLYLALAQELAELLRGRYRIVLRPHPLERVEVYLRFPGGGVGDVLIDPNWDIYSSFVSAHAVVGEVSTGLFEAQGIAGRVLLWETPKARFSCPQHPFCSFADARELVDALQRPQTEKACLREDDIWGGGWIENYRDYLAQVLAAPGEIIIG